MQCDLDTRNEILMCSNAEKCINTSLPVCGIDCNTTAVEVWAGALNQEEKLHQFQCIP